MNDLRQKMTEQYQVKPSQLIAILCDSAHHFPLVALNDPFFLNVVDCILNFYNQLIVIKVSEASDMYDIYIYDIYDEYYVEIST
jgi:hypothetical protein